MSSFITMFIGFSVGFVTAKLMNKGYEKTATAVFAVFVLSLLCYLGWNIWLAYVS